MKNTLSAKAFLLCMAMLLLSLLSNAQIPLFNSIIPNTTTPAKLDKFELNIDLTVGTIFIWKRIQHAVS